MASFKDIVDHLLKGGKIDYNPITTDDGYWAIEDNKLQYFDEDAEVFKDSGPGESDLGEYVLIQDMVQVPRKELEDLKKRLAELERL